MRYMFPALITSGTKPCRRYKNREDLEIRNGPTSFSLSLFLTVPPRHRKTTGN